MRFSIRWALAAMAYVALAAAAMTQREWFYADALWIVAYVALGMAIVIAASGTGRKRIRATGFVAFSALLWACTYGDLVEKRTAFVLVTTGVIDLEAETKIDPYGHRIVIANQAAGGILVLGAGLLGAMLAPLPFGQDEDRLR